MGKCKLFLFFHIFQEKIFDISYCKTWQHNNVSALCVCVLSRFGCVQLCATVWTVVHQAPLSIGFFSQEYWSRYSSILEYWQIPSSRGPSQLRDRTRVSYVSCIARQVFYFAGTPWEVHINISRVLYVCQKGRYISKYK